MGYKQFMLYLLVAEVAVAVVQTLVLELAVAVVLMCQEYFQHQNLVQRNLLLLLQEEQEGMREVREQVLREVLEETQDLVLTFF
jgi:hypothetical protein